MMTTACPHATQISHLSLPPSHTVPCRVSWWCLCLCDCSSQWLGWYAPDPKNVHYPVMIQAIEKLCETFKHKPEDIFLWIGIAPHEERASYAG